MEGAKGAPHYSPLLSAHYSPLHVPAVPSSNVKLLVDHPIISNGLTSFIKSLVNLMVTLGSVSLGRGSMGVRRPSDDVAEVVAEVVAVWSPHREISSNCLRLPGC
eukprot:487814-Prorocentrum_minimum.AAC.1